MDTSTLPPVEETEGWQPEPSADLSLEQIVERAFAYRGDTTLRFADGGELVAFVSNRDFETTEPYLEIIYTEGAGPTRVALSKLRTIHFTGEDIAHKRRHD